jgi:hypothetical protein
LDNAVALFKVGSVKPNDFVHGHVLARWFERARCRARCQCS